MYQVPAGHPSISLTPKKKQKKQEKRTGTLDSAVN